MARRSTKDERIAAGLLMLKRGEEWLIPEPTRSKGTAKQICKCVEWHHTTPWSLTKETKPQALTPLRPDDHAEITRKITIPTAAKIKRGVAKRTGKAKPKKKIPARAFPTKQERQAAKARFAQREMR